MTNKKRPTRIYKRNKDSKNFYILKNNKRVKVNIPANIKTKKDAQKYIMDKLYTVLDDTTITSYTQELPKRINYRYPSSKTRANRKSSGLFAINNQAKAIRAYEAKLKEQQLEKEKLEAKQLELKKYEEEKRNTISRERTRKREEAKKIAIQRDTLRLEEKKTNDLVQMEREKLKLLEEKQRRERRAERELNNPRPKKKPVDNKIVKQQLPQTDEQKDQADVLPKPKLKRQSNKVPIEVVGPETEEGIEDMRTDIYVPLRINKIKKEQHPKEIERQLIAKAKAKELAPFERRDAIASIRKSREEKNPGVIDEPQSETEKGPYVQEEVKTKLIPKGLKERGLSQDILAANRASEKLLGQTTDEEDPEEKVPQLLADITQSGEGKTSSKLPALYSDEIDEFFKTDNRYTGTIASDQISELPKQIPQGVIINADQSYEPGSHWRAMYITPDSVEWFDPFGDPPTNEEKLAIKKKLIEWEVPNLMKFKINRIKQQHGNSHHCGYHCLRYLSDRFDGIDFPLTTRYSKIGGIKDNHKQGEAIIKKEFSYI